MQGLQKFTKRRREQKEARVPGCGHLVQLTATKKKKKKVVTKICNFEDSP